MLGVVGRNGRKAGIGAFLGKLKKLENIQILKELMYVCLGGFSDSQLNC